MTHPATCSFLEFADIANVRPSYVTELRKAGRLVLTADGKRVSVAESLQRIEDTRDPSRAGVAARHAAARGGATTPPAPVAGGAGSAADAVDDDDEDAPDDKSSPFHRHRAEKEYWNSLAAKRDYEQSMGKLMDASEVESAIANAGVTLRRTLERIPDQLAPQLAPVSDEAKIRALLVDSIEEALRELARQFGEIAKREVQA